MVFVAFLIAVFSRRIVGWRAMKNMRTDLVLDTLEQALWARGKPQGVTHHSDRGNQYLSIAYNKTLAVQADLLANPRKAKEVAVLQLRGASDFTRTITQKPHKAHEHFEQAIDKPSAYQTLEAENQRLSALLGNGKPLDGLALYRVIKKLSDNDLESLLIALTVMPFGQGKCEELDCGNSLFNAIARDLKTDMKQHWTADREFFDKRNAEQLRIIAKECGYSDGRGFISSYKKSELVVGLERFFAEANAAKKPTKAQKKARNWLPEAMRFPAKNPDDKAKDHKG